MPKLVRLTCGAFDGTPKNVRLQNALPELVTTLSVVRLVYLIGAPVLPGAPSGSGGVSRSRVVNK